MLRAVLLSLLLIGCNQGNSYPHKIQPTPTDPLPSEEPTSTICHVSNDCPVSMLCKVATGQCVECLNEDHCPLHFTCTNNVCEPVAEGDPDQPGDPFQPGDPDVPPGDPGQQPGDNDIPIDTCTYGICTEDSDYYLCLEEDGSIPWDNPYCDYYTYEGCPDYMTPFLVTWDNGWEDCICIEEC